MQAIDKIFCLNHCRANWWLWDLLLVIYENSEENVREYKQPDIYLDY